MADRIERADNPLARDFLRGSEDLVASLVRGDELDRAVPAAIDLVGKNPLVSAGRFPGDVLRALMEIPGGFWSRHVELFDRYRAALRAAAVMRRTLPLETRFEFWQPLDIRTPE